MRAQSEDSRAMNPPDHFQTKRLELFERFMLGGIPGKEMVKREMAGVRPNPAINVAVKSIGRPDWDDEVSRYTPTN